MLNAAIGFGTEWRARISLARLRALAVPRALVRRGGHTILVPAADLVPGDLIVLAGAQVPAEARLVKSAALRVNEATLTGESEPAEKDAALSVDVAAALAERRTMVYLGTAVLSGSGAAVVIATGVATELGRVGENRVEILDGAIKRRRPPHRRVAPRPSPGKRVTAEQLIIGRRLSPSQSRKINSCEAHERGLRAPGEAQRPVFAARNHGNLALFLASRRALVMRGWRLR